MKAAKQYNNAEAGSVIQVRTLRVCYWCDGLGNSDAMIEGREATNAATEESRSVYWHGRCFIFVHGEAGFLKLAREQTNKMRLDDIGVPMMKKLLASW